jgi:hypothetical protein
MSGMHDKSVVYAPTISVCAICEACIRDDVVAETDARKEESPRVTVWKVWMWQE